MGEKQERVVVRGLRDVAAAETKISYVNSNGTLYYLGYDIDDLVERVCYEEVAHLLLYNKLPNKKELDEFRFQPCFGDETARASSQKDQTRTEGLPSYGSSTNRSLTSQ